MLPAFRAMVVALLASWTALSCGAAKDLMLWNGETQNHGSGWVSPEGDPYLSFEVQEQVSHSPSRAVKFHLDATEKWIECAWRWFPWFPPAAGTNFKAYRAIQFALKISIPFPSDDLHVRLDSAPLGLKSKMLSLKSYDAGFADGHWHVLTIPLHDFDDAGMTYDPTHAAELFFGVYLQRGPLDFYLDDLKLLGAH